MVLLYDTAHKSLCTGTFISDDTVLTAAHCTMGSPSVDPDTGRVSGLSLTIMKLVKASPKTMSKVASSVDVFRNTHWDRAELTKTVNEYDLGIVKFPPGTSNATARLAADSPSAGNKLTVVGYGLNFIPKPGDATYDHSSSGIKRAGTNTVSAVEDGFIRFEGQDADTSEDGTNVSSSHGDSGGPMFVDEQLVGVTSGGGINDSGHGVSLYIDLNSATSRSFLQGAMGLNY